jgi:hypothetical protein
MTNEETSQEPRQNSSGMPMAAEKWSDLGYIFKEELTTLSDWM